MNFKLHTYFFFLTILLYSNWTISQKSNNKSSKEIDSLMVIALTNDIYDIKQTFDLLKKAQFIAKKNKNYEKEISVLNELSKLTLNYKHDFKEASSYINRIRSIALENNNNPKYLASYHNGLGVLYFNDRTDRKRASKEFKTAIRILEKNKLKPNHYHLNNYAVALYTDQKYEEAITYLKLALNQYKPEEEIVPNSDFPGMVSMNIGICFAYQKELDSAEVYLKKCVEIALKNESYEDLYKAYTYLGVFYQENDNNQEALKIFNKIVGSEDKFQNEYRTKAQLYEGLANALAQLNDFKNAYKYRAIQQLYEDTIKSFDLNKQAFMMEYHSELDSLKQSKQLIELNSKITEGQLTKRYYLMFLLATLFLSAFGFLLFKIKKTKELNKITLENEKLEKQKLKQEAEINLLKSQETITSKNIQLSIRDNELEQIKTSLQNHLDKSTDPQFDDLKKFLRLAKTSEKRNEQLRFLDDLVRNTNNVFYKKLKSKHPDLTQSELKLSLLINLNLSSNELTEMFNISLSSLNTKRYRLRKKLNISKSDSLEQYLINL